MKRIPEEIRIQQINALPSIEFVRWEGIYKNSKSKAVCRCAVDGFEWSASVNNLVDGGHGCPECGRLSVRVAQRSPAIDIERKINGLPNISFVRWDGEYRNNKSKAVCKCKIDGHEWSASAHSLIDSGCGCPKCGRLSSANIRRTPEAEAINKINNLPNIQFLRWEGKYERSVSRAVCLCGTCGNVWMARAINLTSMGHGCPKCSIVRRANSRRTPEAQYLHRLNSKPNVTFVKWADGYVDSYSKAICRCDIDGHEWAAPINHLVNYGSGCPKCAPYGFQLGMKGALYALRSDCGRLVKIGITNKPSRRYRQLEMATPFAFSVIEQVHGDGDKIAELEKYFHRKYQRAGLSGFDGCTEWLHCTDALMQELRGMGR